MEITSSNRQLFYSLAFRIVLHHLEYQQVVKMQLVSKQFYDFVIPWHLKDIKMVVRPDFIFFDFSSIKSQVKSWMADQHSSEAKSSEDEAGLFFYARIWFFHVKNT